MLDPQRLSELKQLNMRFMQYQPQPIQTQVHESASQVLVISGGEGSGKSVVTAAEIAARYGLWKKVLLVCYKTKSATNESDYLYDFLKNFGAVREYHKPEGGNISLTTRDGCIVESVSTYAEGSRAVTGTGKSYDIIAMLEAGKQRYEVFLACLIRIQRTGGLLILSGTIEKSEPWFADVINRLQQPNELGAQVIIMPTWENHLDYPGGRDDPKIKRLEGELTPELFMERLGGKPSPLDSLVFKEFSFLTHVFEWVQYDDKLPIELWIDPGYSGSHYAVLFTQQHPRSYTRQFKSDLPEVSLTDVFVIGDLYLDHAIHEEVIRLMQVEQPYATWYNHVMSAIGDVAMFTHPLAGQAPDEVWKAKTDGRIQIRGKYLLIQDGIDRHHTFLKDPSSQSPRIFFHPNCKGLIEYSRWKRKEVGENIYGAPEAQNCDTLKAINYGLVYNFGLIEHLTKPNVIATGTRIKLEQSQHQLPADVTQNHPTPVPLHRSSYVVVPRQPKFIPGQINREKPIQ